MYHKTALLACPEGLPIYMSPSVMKKELPFSGAEPSDVAPPLLRLRLPFDLNFLRSTAGYRIPYDSRVADTISCRIWRSSCGGGGGGGGGAR